VAPPGALEVASQESLALGWFPLDELPRELDDSTARLAARAVERSPR
jgi:hypothetical protein